MRRHLFDLAVLVAGGTIAAGAVALVVPSVRGTTIHVYVLALAAVALATLLAAIGDRVPRATAGPVDAVLAGRPQAPGRVADLERLERAVSLSLASEWDLHSRLLPLLREVAAARLERSGRPLTEETAGRWWDLLRPDRPPPEDHFHRGISAAELAALVDDLDALAPRPPGRM